MKKKEFIRYEFNGVYYGPIIAWKAFVHFVTVARLTIISSLGRVLSSLERSESQHLHLVISGVLMANGDEE